MGDCLNELGMEDLKLLEEEMDKAAKVVRERKVRLIICSYLYTSCNQASYPVHMLFENKSKDLKFCI